MRPAIAVLLAGLAVTPAFAQEDEHVFTFGPITIEHPWARAAAAGADTLAFVEIVNDGPPDLVVGLSTAVAASVELVGLTIRNGVIELVPVEGFEIPPGAFTFDPNGLGLALRGLTEPLVEGTEFELTLTLENAGDLTFHVLVEAADAVGHDHAH